MTGRITARVIVSAALCGAVLPAFRADATPVLEADLILHGGEVYTPNGWAEALAIQDGVIIAVGDDAEAEAEAYRTRREHSVTRSVHS